MNETKKDERVLTDIDEAEAAVYSQIFGFFDKDSGNFLKVDVKENAKDKKLPKSETAKFNAVTEKSDQETKNKDEVYRFIEEISQKEISSMAITINVNGNVEEYVNDEKAGERYLPIEAQIEKIKLTISGFKDAVIVHSEEEFLKLQEEFKHKQEKAKIAESKAIGTNREEASEPAIKTQVYIRIPEKDYEAVKDIIDKENIKIMANMVKTRDDKSGINMVIKFQDADKVRHVLSQNDIAILQDVDGNIDWEDIKKRSNKFDNITVEQLREFQAKNKDKFDYIAFRKDDTYTIFADKKCDITIGTPGRKTVKQIDNQIHDFRNNSAKSEKSIKNKTKNTKEDVR